ncbi:Zinc finger protein klf1 [Leucoagaricus sp. SymC.cos]|nr:Zinc finger protein klf1 [Leucoagaricus sp. SymC.cos]
MQTQDPLPLPVLQPTQSELAAALGTDAPLPIQPNFEPLRKKDGTLSKIRSHRGNIPVLPQTKLCPHCPAKFTRTTHLNRHLRNHTNERLHRCDTCDSHFTRSDLLTRHKKSCSNPTSRSRRRSCLACMESKIKCDRQVPCAKCVSKGTECVYGPANRRLLVSPTTAKTSKIPGSSSTGPASTTEQNRGLNQTTTSASTSTSISHPNHSGTKTSPQPNSPSNTSVASSSSASTRTPEPIQSSGLTYVQDPEVYRQQSQLTGPIEPSIQTSPPAGPISSAYSSIPTFDNGFVNEGFSPPDSDSTSTDDQLIPVSSHLSPAYDSDVFTPFFTNIFPQLAPPSVLTEVTLNIEELNVRGDSPEDFPFARLLIDSSSSPPATQSPLFSADAPTPKPDPLQTFEVDRGLGRLRPLSPDPTPRELSHYLHIFFTTFLMQIPIVHAPTFRAEEKSPLLLSAMQACGALFVGTRRATDFISKTLAYARETLVHDFAKKSTDFIDQIQLILAVVLLQTIGLFHQDMDQRASSSIYHGMLVMMIRQTGLIPCNASWQPSRIHESTLDSAWFDWARHEMAKRAILWSFMHDCCHCIYFALPSSYHPQEVILNLPCEDALWQATSAADWYMVLQRSSPYGTTQSSRLTGMNIPKMVAYLSETRTIPTAVPLNAMAHFVLIHITLKQLFQYCVGGKPPRAKTIGGDDEMDPQMFKLQFALHNWLHNWKHSPDSRIETGTGEPPFVQNLVPFYWLGQVAMLAYQENLPPFEYASPNNFKVEVRFRLVKRWLRHIRSFLKSHDEAPTLFWDELMQLRLQSWQQEDPEEGDEGLLEFFSELS